MSQYRSLRKQVTRWGGLLLGLGMASLVVAACSCEGGPGGPPNPPPTREPVKSTCIPYKRALVVPVQKDNIQVRSATWSWGGDAFATVSQDGRILVRDATYGVIQHSMRYPVNTEVWKVAFTPDDKGLLTVGDDGTVRLWQDGKEARSFLPPQSGFRSRAFDVRLSKQNGADVPLLVVGYFSGQKGYLSWRTLDANGAGVGAQTEVAAGVDSVALSPDGSKTAVGLANGSIEIRDSSTGKALVTLAGAHTASVTSLSWASKGDFLASGSVDTLVKVWRFASATKLEAWQTLQSHQHPVTSVVFSQTAPFLASTSMSPQDGTQGSVKIWDVEAMASSKNAIRELPQMTYLPKQGSWGVSWHPNPNQIKILSTRFSGEIVVKVVDGAPKLLITHPHQSPVTQAFYSPDSNKWAWSTEAGMIHVRDDLMRVIDKKINLPSPVERLRWERIKQHLFVGLRNGELHRVDWENEKSIEVFKGPAAVSSLAVRRDGTGLFVGFKDGTVMLFANSLQAPILQLNTLHNGAVLSAHWSYEGDLLATVGKDKSIKVWRFNRDKKKLEVEATLDAQGGTPLQVRFSSHDELMAVGFAQGKLGIWSRKNSRWKVHQTSHGTSLLAWNNLEKDILLTAAHRDDPLSQTDRNIHMWNAGKSEDLHHLWVMNGGDKHHKQPITSLTVNWNDQAMASSSMDGGFGIWKLRRAYGIMSASYASSPVSLATRNDGAQVIAGTSSSMVHMYNVANAQEPSLRMMKGHNQSVGHILLNQEGSRLFSAGLDGALLMWDMNSYTPTMMSTFPAPSSSFKPEKLVTGMALSPDQKTVVMASWTRKYAAESDGWKRAGLLTFWSLSNNSEPQQVFKDIPLVYTVAYHPTKDIIITGHTANRTYIWHKQNGTWSIKQELLNQHPLGTTIVSFSGDGQLVATSGRLGDIRVWEWETGKTIQRFDTGGAAPSRLLFHPNKSVLAASLGNGKVKIWDLSTGSLSRLLTDPDLAAKGMTEQAHNGSVNSMAWSGDGTTLYTSGSDLKIKQWKCPEPQ